MGDLVPCIGGVAVLLPAHVDPEGSMCLSGGGEEHYHADLRYEARSEPFSIRSRGHKPTMMEKEKINSTAFPQLCGFFVFWATTRPNSRVECGRCPHQKVKVQATADGFRCPAHGLMFDADGKIEVPTHVELDGVQAIAGPTMEFKMANHGSGGAAMVMQGSRALMPLKMTFHYWSPGDLLRVKCSEGT